MKLSKCRTVSENVTTVTQKLSTSYGHATMLLVLLFDAGFGGAEAYPKPQAGDTLSYIYCPKLMNVIFLIRRESMMTACFKYVTVTKCGS